MIDNRAAWVLRSDRVRVSRKTLEDRMIDNRAAWVLRSDRVRVSRKTLEDA